MDTTTEYKDADEAWEAGNEWIKQSDKWEKLEFLKETCTTEFLQETLPHELMKFMNEFEVNEFFNHLRRNWAVMTPQELDYDMNS
jgi:hypothetical protein